MPPPNPAPIKRADVAPAKKIRSVDAMIVSRLRGAQRYSLNIVRATAANF
jgi:hypothetical protein